jgi:tetratricopeptide (TPR) repeat protein
VPAPAAAVVALLLGVSLATLPGLDPETARGFDRFFNLEFDEAIAVFRRAIGARPQAPHLRNHLAQAILYRELLKGGALETELVTGGNAFLRRSKMNPSEQDQAEFDQAIAEAIRLSQAMLDKSPADPGALYTMGVAYGLRGNYSFLVRKSWMAALRDATQCRKLHNRVTEIDPTLVDARMTQGVHDYVVGSLSWTYRALGFLTGFAGDRVEGIRTVERVWREGTMNQSDAGVLLATVYRRERRPADAVRVLESLVRRYPRNYLFRFELGQMYSDLGNKEKALSAISEVEKLKSLNTPALAALPIEKVFYFRATVQFWYRDLSNAAANFERVTEKASDLDPNTGVTAWMRLGQTYDLMGRRGEALEAYRKAIAYAPGSYRARESEGYLRAPYQRKQG